MTIPVPAPSDRCPWPSGAPIVLPCALARLEKAAYTMGYKRSPGQWGERDAGSVRIVGFMRGVVQQARVMVTAVVGTRDWDERPSSYLHGGLRGDEPSAEPLVEDPNANVYGKRTHSAEVHDAHTSVSSAGMTRLDEPPDTRHVTADVDVVGSLGDTCVDKAIGVQAERPRHVQDDTRA